MVVWLILIVLPVLGCSVVAQAPGQWHISSPDVDPGPLGVGDTLPHWNSPHRLHSPGLKYMYMHVCICKQKMWICIWAQTACRNKVINTNHKQVNSGVWWINDKNQHNNCNCVYVLCVWLCKLHMYATWDHECSYMCLHLACFQECVRVCLCVLTCHPFCPALSIIACSIA